MKRILLVALVAMNLMGERPRVGLALAGGGAKGLAHIGVLKWMEDNRVPVDAIGGTSMGGLVGGIYATGREPAEIQKFVEGIEWGVVLGPAVQYRELGIRRKEDLQSFPALFTLGYKKGKLRLPAGLNAGHQVGLLLDRVVTGYARLESFDALPTPFRCVAADLLTGDKVVFSRGPLDVALRATMSLPGIFAPLQYEDKLLVDGGIVDNIPADVVRKMNVDVVVAVDLGMVRVDGAQPISILDVASRSIDIMLRRNEIESLKNANIVVKPDVTGYSTLGFKDIDKVIQIGYEAAAARAAELKRYALGEAEWKAHVASRQARRQTGEGKREFVEVTGVAPREAKELAERIAVSQEKGRTLEQSLTEIAGMGSYDSASYREVVKNGKEGVEVTVRETTYGPPFIRPLLVLDSGQGGNASFTVGARLAAFRFPSRNSEWRTDFSYGRIRSLSTEYYQFVGVRGAFLAGRGFYTDERQLIVSNKETLAEYGLRRIGAGADVGWNFGRFSEVRTGLELAQLRGTVKVGLPILPDVRGQERLWRSRWRWNSLNSGSVPTEGISVDSEVDWQFRSAPVTFLGQTLLGRDGFGQAWTQVQHARRLKPGWSTLTRLYVGRTFGGEVAPFSEFRLGGPGRLGALEVGEKRGANVLFGSTGVLRQLGDVQSSLFGKFYVNVQYEVGDAFDKRVRLFHSGSAGLMAETAIGVVSAGYSYGESGRGGFYFSVGRFFDFGIR